MVEKAETEKPWTLAERCHMANLMAKGGATREEIVSATALTLFTASCIVNRHRPGTYSSLGKSALE